MSSIYKRFRESNGRDGPDFSILDDIDCTERQKLANEFLENLDYYDALALGRISLSSTPTKLLDCLHATKDLHLRMAAARAVWDIEKSESALRVIEDVIRNYTDSGEFDYLTRVRAVNLLVNVLHPIAFSALEAGFYDTEYVVRANAATIYSLNSRIKTGDDTIERNLLEFDHSKIEKFVKKMRKKI